MLVDLAGSERAAASEGKSVLRAEEAKAINLSLSALGSLGFLVHLPQIENIVYHQPDGRCMRCATV